MDIARFLYLMQRYEQGLTSAPEESELLSFFGEPGNREEITGILVNAIEETPFSDGINPGRWQPVIDRILDRDQEELALSAPEPRIIPRRRVILFWAAAAVFVCVLVGIYLLNNRPVRELAPQVVRFHNDVPPGRNQAVLTLSSGRYIVLDSAANGTLAQQGGVTILKTASGQLQYQGSSTEVAYNSLTTPRGGQYQLDLPDGTKVWLNALSAIRYPTAFTGSDRTVDIDGEAYFEVSPDKNRPFKVRIRNSAELTVLGTSFNINAYADETGLRTTLVSGAVRMSASGRVISLTAGQAGVLPAAGSDWELVKHADLDQDLAWKNGLFSFRSADIQTVMRQIARWYDVDLTYEKITKETFFVKMSRNTPLSTVLKILETTGGVHFTIDGKKITVLP